jgi:hypothetical protein
MKIESPLHAEHQLDQLSGQGTVPDVDVWNSTPLVSNPL